jgi:quinol monooxygenase YgiN
MISKTIYLVLFITLISNVNTHAQQNKQIVRLAKLVIDSAQLKNFNRYLKEEIEASVKLEARVLTLYAVAEKEKPTRITILEIYANTDAYNKHIQSSHSLKYKTRQRTWSNHWNWLTPYLSFRR